MNTYFARGGSFSGGRSSFHSSSRTSSTRSSTSSKSTTSKSTSRSTAPAKPKTSSKVGTSHAKPGSKIKTANGKTVQSSAKHPTNHKYSRSTGVVGDNGYSPRFTNGYVAPAGSVVYYPQHSSLDYLPWIYLFSMNNSPHNDQATVVQPNNKEVVAKPETGGIDGMMIFNWIVLILVCAAILAGVVYLVNKLTSRQPAHA